eukprot:TRINITY_DN23911_c0_g1_i1.p1 TRINITY_DN23911_c0_g1~~TRINITY_DN23911_c0_g1_i1.p1  ORF type:complete len:478 (+),score=14.41 TRINITY_DN23911_c0_g1_i1:19-1452(+)
MFAFSKAVFSYLDLSVYRVCLPAWLSVRQSASLGLSTCLSVCVSVCLPACLPVSACVRVCVYVSVSTCMSVCPPVFLLHACAQRLSACVCSALHPSGNLHISVIVCVFRRPDFPRMLRRFHRVTHDLLSGSTLQVAVPHAGQQTPILQSSGYRRCAVGFLALQFTVCTLWQVDGLQRWLWAHGQCSWKSVVSEGRWWAALFAHGSHRDPEHLAVNLGLLSFPAFFLQRLLTWPSLVFVSVSAAAASSLGSLLLTYALYAPGEARECGATPWVAARYCESMADHPWLKYYNFRNAFDEFVFLRDCELLAGFDTMCSEQPYINDLNRFCEETRLKPGRACELGKLYEEWTNQTGRGSMGSSALASCLGAICALWFLELRHRGWRHPVLLFFPLVCVLQPLDDMRVLVRSSADSENGSEVVAATDTVSKGSGHQTPSEADAISAVGHLAGTVVGVLAYCCLRVGGLTTKLHYPLLRVYSL